VANAEGAESVLGVEVREWLELEEKKSEMLSRWRRVVEVARGGEVLVLVLVVPALVGVGVGVDVEDGGRLWSSS